MKDWLAINPIDVKEKFPKAYKNIIAWLSKSSIEGVPMTEEIINAFIYGNPRFLYDYFDDNQAVVSVFSQVDGFHYKFDGEEISKPYPARHKAENDMIYEGLRIVEHKLK